MPLGWWFVTRNVNQGNGWWSCICLSPAMMTSPNENVICVSGFLCGEFICHRWNPRKKATDKLWCFFDLRLNRQLSKQCRHWWFETLPRSLWCHCNASLCHQFFDERIYLQYIQPRTRQIDIFSTRIKIKTTSLGILFNQNPRRHSKQKPWVRWTKGFCLGDLWGGSGWTEYRPSVFFFLSHVFYLHGDLFLLSNRHLPKVFH